MEYHEQEPGHNSGLKWGLGIMVLALVVFAAASLTYITRERSQMSQLASANQTLNTSLGQLQSQIQTMNQKLNERAAPAPAAPVVSSRQRTGAVRAASPAADPRIKQLQSRIADQQKQIDTAREDLGKTRDDLQSKIDSQHDELSGNLNSTRDELNGSIARTHDEVVALQKRGERNYFEFQLTKSKDFHRVGNLSLSLRKANTKRKSYDLAMIVDDNTLQKKSVNLYEPIWINVEDAPQPLELVVNQIGKDQISGYISAPKYKRSELETKADSTRPPLPPAHDGLTQQQQ